jgi:hypothetical protein
MPMATLSAGEFTQMVAVVRNGKAEQPTQPSNTPIATIPKKNREETDEWLKK